jgi:hypothetical protein
MGVSLLLSTRRLLIRMSQPQAGERTNDTRWTRLPNIIDEGVSGGMRLRKVAKGPDAENE